MCRGYDLYLEYDVYWVRHVYRELDVCAGSWMCVGSTSIRQDYKGSTYQTGGSRYVPGSLTCVPWGSTSESDVYRCSGVSTGRLACLPVA